MHSIALYPRVSGVGGMVSFQRKLAAGLQRRGIQVTFDPSQTEAVLIVGGSWRLEPIIRARARGARLVQRLDGMNWLHHKLRTRMSSGRLRHYLRAETGNWLLALIRARLAQHVVYQSEFSKKWWEQVRGPTHVPNSIVYNGVDLEQYTPEGAHERPQERVRLLLVEGSLMGGYEYGLEAALDLGDKLAQRMPAPFRLNFPNGVELVVVGRVPNEVQNTASQRARISIRWLGLVPAEHIPYIDRSAHLLYSADVNAACPNSVIEALACGLPVLAFDTGALPELLADGAGIVTPYGGNPWRLEAPDTDALAESALQILAEQPGYAKAARRRAEREYSLEKMVDGYLHALGGGVS